MLGVKFIQQIRHGGTLGRSMGLRDMRWSAMLKRRGQGVELNLLGEGGLGWSERVASGAFPSDL